MHFCVWPMELWIILQWTNSRQYCLHLFLFIPATCDTLKRNQKTKLNNGYFFISNNTQSTRINYNRYVRRSIYIFALRSQVIPHIVENDNNRIHQKTDNDLFSSVWISARLIQDQRWWLQTWCELHVLIWTRNMYVKRYKRNFAITLLPHRLIHLLYLWSRLWTLNMTV